MKVDMVVIDMPEIDAGKEKCIWSFAFRCGAYKPTICGRQERTAPEFNKAYNKWRNISSRSSGYVWVAGKYVLSERKEDERMKMENEKVLVTRTFMPPYEEYIEAIKPLWDSHWITNMGIYHREFEEKLVKYLGVPEVSLMVNGHMALEMTIQAFDFPAGSEVITTPFTFISTTHAIVRNNLVPVFCDVKLNDGTIDETKIEELITSKTVAIVPVHVYGNLCNVEAIQRIADKHHLKVIYDAAHAFGEKYKGVGIGNFGDASIFSFHATKVFNSIEGGVVTFKNHDLYNRLYNLKNFGIRGEEIVEAVGANAKMNEFCAIMGLCNLKYVDEIILKRKQIWELYLEKLRMIEGIEFFEDSENLTYKNFAYFPIVISDKSKYCRDEVYLKLKKQNIYSRKYFYPIITEQQCYKDKYRNHKLVNSYMLSERILVLPFHDELQHEVIDKIINELK